MTTVDPFSATPPFIKSSKSRGKPRIPEAGLRCSVPSKQRCTLHVCLKWKHELVLASKAAASKFSLEPKCSSQQTALLAENKGERQAPARGCWSIYRAAAISAAGYLQIKWLDPTTSVRGLKHSAIRKHIGKYFFLPLSRRMFLSSSFCLCPLSAALCDFPFHFKLSVPNTKGNDVGLFYTQVVYPIKKGAPCCGKQWLPYSGNA